MIRKRKKGNQPKRKAQPRRKRKRSQPNQLSQFMAASTPRAKLPKTARKRRKRKQREKMGLPAIASALRWFFITPRWLSLGLLIVNIYALYLIGTDARFFLNSVPVKGAQIIPAEEILKASQLAGVHVFAADPNQAADRIANVPGVVSATVSLQWPNHIEITVGEDAPIAIWEEAGTEFWINADGRLIPARLQLDELLVIHSERVIADIEQSSEDIETGNDSASEEDGTISNQAKFIAPELLAGALQLQQLVPNIESLFYRPAGGLSFEDERGWRVYFGVNADMDQKLVIYETIVKEILAKNQYPVYISVSNQQKPYYLAN